MRTVPAVSAAILSLSVLMTSTALAQTAATEPSASVPRVINVAGVFQPVDGQPLRAVETLTLALYTDPTGGTPLWQETQSIAVDTKGRYALLLGATSAEGVPAAVLAAGAQWLGTTFDRPGEVESQRVQVTSVPYALRAADADTLGGHPASAYLLAPSAATGKDGTATTTGTGSTATPAGQASATSAAAGAPPAPDVVQPGAVNFLAKYVTGADVGNSAVFENAGRVGIGTAAPLDALHVNFTDPNGAITGYAVQNLGNTPTSYSGMLFYDQNGALGQFQGFNNVTHEYRINNIARNGASLFDGSINFMTGFTSRFLVAPTGNIGIGTTTPSALLEVSNAIPGGPANVWTTSFTNAVGPYYLARRSRGTPAAPTQVLTGDGLSGLYGQGYGTTQFGPGNGGITVQAAQNFTDTAQGTALTFSTTPINSVTPSTRMTLDAFGFLGLGTITTPPAGMFEVSNAAVANALGSIVSSNFSNTSGPLFIGRRARGIGAAPSAVLGGDNLAAYLAQGFGTTGFSGTRGGMFVQAAENWTDTAQGTRLNFNTTASGTTGPSTKMTVDPTGKVGIGTLNPDGQLEVSSSTGHQAVVMSTAYTDGHNCCSAFIAQSARGTAAAPTAVQAGDFLGSFGFSGYGTTSFNDVFGIVAGFAAENFTDTARGTSLGLGTTPLGTKNLNLVMSLLPSGNVGIGTPADSSGLPTATDKLQVFGDVRVGTSGTNGCLKDFSGTGIAGTCASDRRFKRNITRFGPVLDRFAALQPVRYYWRAAEFPDQHFGDTQAYGLVAQDVEQVLPELVVTRTDGYKAVNYSELPMLTIQAVKELKAENDDLKAQNDALKARVTEIERLIKEMRPTSQR